MILINCLFRLLPVKMQIDRINNLKGILERNQGQKMPADSGFATPVIDPEIPLMERTGEVEGELNGMFDSTYFDN